MSVARIAPTKIDADINELFPIAWLNEITVPIDGWSTSLDNYSGEFLVHPVRGVILFAIVNIFRHV